MQSRTTRPFAIVALVLALFVVGCAGSNQATNAGSSSSMAASATAAATGAASLYQSLGGSSGVTALASQFGTNLSANPLITQALSAADIATAKDGLYNSIAKLAGQATTGNGADLLTALSGKKLDGIEKPDNYLYGTRLVRLCCSDCRAEFQKNPDALLAKIHAARQKDKEAKPAGAEAKKTPDKP